MTEAQVRALLAEHSEAAGSQKILAPVIGVSTTYLSDVINGRRRPGPAVLAYLDLREVVTYEPIIRRKV